jgi:hypothetical protein
MMGVMGAGFGPGMNGRKFMHSMTGSESLFGSGQRTAARKVNVVNCRDIRTP